MATELKGVLGPQSQRAHCPWVAGVTGQRGSPEGCLASGNSHCSCRGNRAKSHPVTSCEEIQKGWGAEPSNGLLTHPLQRDGGWGVRGLGGGEGKNGKSFSSIWPLLPGSLGGLGGKGASTGDEPRPARRPQAANSCLKPSCWSGPYLQYSSLSPWIPLCQL